MPAGPYPTKTLFEALKERVEALENGGEAGAGTFVGLPSLAAPGGTPTNVYQLVLSWRRRTVHVAGFRLAGDVPLSALSGVAVSDSAWENGVEALGWNPSGGGNMTLTRQVTGAGPQAYTDFLFSRSITRTDSNLRVTFAPGYPLPVQQQALSPQDGVTVRLQDENFGVIPGVAYIELLSARTFEVPVVPVPSDPIYGEGSDSTRHVEVVWPGSGAPYLHVYQAQDDEGNQAHYHLPLTPGLPQ